LSSCWLWVLQHQSLPAGAQPEPDSVADVASRPATAMERAELAAAIGVAPECIDATVSTVDPQWAFFFSTNIPSCPQADGYVVLRREVTGWQVRLQESGVGACPLGHVPTRVAGDLGLCRKPRTYILCQPPGRLSERRLRSHPARCNTLGLGQAFARAANLARLRWRGWGRPVTRARGIERGFHRPLAHIPVRVKAYRRRRCPFGDLIYTRLRATSHYGSLVVRYPANCGDGGQAASGRPAETADVVAPAPAEAGSLGAPGSTTATFPCETCAVAERESS
jgi:hypothetical protein